MIDGIRVVEGAARHFDAEAANELARPALANALLVEPEKIDSGRDAVADDEKVAGFTR